MIASTGCWGMGLNIGGLFLATQSDILQTWMIHSTAKILTFYPASEYKYSSYIYNTRLNQRPDVKSTFRQSVKPNKVEDGIVMRGRETSD